MADAIQVSLAIVTRNRPESLARCLSSIRAGLPTTVEIVVSDDSEAIDADNTQRVSTEFGCRYLTGPRRGLYANRNRAALACRGTHIRTVDDDQTFPTGHFDQCLSALGQDPNSIWTTGEITYIEGKWAGRVETANQLHPSGVGGPIRNRDDNWGIADGSTIYPRSIFDAGLRMVEAFGYGSSYLEFGAYLYQHGYHSRCLPGLLVEHHPDRATFSRGQDLNMVKSRLFASLCFNLYFQPNRVRFLKYLSSYCFLRGSGLKLLWSLPALLQWARQRWQVIPPRLK